MTVDGDITHGNGGLYGVGPIDEINFPLCRRIRATADWLREVGLLPTGKPLFQLRDQGCGLYIPGNREDGVLRHVVFPAPPCEVVGSHGLEGTRRGARHCGRKRAVHRAVETLSREESGLR